MKPRAARYIPLLSLRMLTPLYDPLLRWGMAEDAFKRRLITRAQIRSGQRVLDLGCGTGTLTLMIKQLVPEAEVTGIDGDPQALALARAKAARARVSIKWDDGLAFELPYPDRSFDVVVSSLVIHHLRTEDKRRAFQEIRRVLRRGGWFHAVDFGSPNNLLSRMQSVVMAHLEEAADNWNGRIPDLLAESGFAGVSATDPTMTIFGNLWFYKARRKLTERSGKLRPAPRKLHPAEPKTFTGTAATTLKPQRSFAARVRPLLVVGAFLAGLLMSYVAWGRSGTPAYAAAPAQVSTRSTEASIDVAALMRQVEPSDGYSLGVSYGDLGPRLLAGGVIDYDAFAALFAQSGSPLTRVQTEALQRGSDAQIILTPENSRFLLNFFWAVGLANRNSILTDGPMVRYSQGRIEGFASTGGWTIGATSVKELYASPDLIALTAEQQSRLEEVASAVYRPCCDNPTSFPDCNHGMAMLGLLELMASRNATVDEMFTAAKYVNAFWFPQQALETAIYLKAYRNVDFAQADPRMLVGAGLASGSGFASIHRDLQVGGQLPQQPEGGANCAN